MTVFIHSDLAAEYNLANLNEWALESGYCSLEEAYFFRPLYSIELKTFKSCWNDVISLKAAEFIYFLQFSISFFLECLKPFLHYISENI